MGTKSHPKNALAAIFVAKTRKPGRYADGNGLYLIIEPSGSRRWEQRILIRGKRRTLGLGGYPLVSLAAAREKALENRRVARAGHDPLATRHAVTRVPTFADATARVFELRKPGWRSARHAAQWISSLNEYAMPRLGARSVAEIDAAEIIDVLSPLWHTMPVTAQRLRQRIGVVLKWAIAQGYRRDNPADAVPYALGPQSRRPVHQASIHYSEVADAISTVRESTASKAARLALEFMHRNDCWNSPRRTRAVGYASGSPPAAIATSCGAETKPSIPPVATTTSAIYHCIRAGFFACANPSQAYCCHSCGLVIDRSRENAKQPPPTQHKNPPLVRSSNASA